jgi:hypothetical protein
MILGAASRSGCASFHRGRASLMTLPYLKIIGGLALFISQPAGA